MKGKAMAGRGRKAKNVDRTKEPLTDDQMKLIAKLMTIHCYRNSPIEDIHAGAWPRLPNGELADEDDVIVTTKQGGTAVPWKKCSRISDEEMKQLNKTIHNQI